ncbi:MAG: LytTR family DNA-binding domain-containing protein [Prevotella sp.]|nr:LytTR family DNA-binding domain-containing protein [Prevotella sp.]
MSNNVIFIKDGSKSYWINVTEVLYVKASGNYCDIFLKSVNYKTVRIQIGQFFSKVEELQVPHNLVRIDRSTILNIKLVEFVNPKKNTITLRHESNVVILQVAKTAIAPLKEKLSELFAEEPKSSYVSFVNRCVKDSQKQKNQTHNGYEYVDLELPSGTLWAANDMIGSTPFEFALLDRPYLEVENNAEEGSFESFLQIEDDAARVKLGGNWRIPTTEEWKELFKECKAEWVVSDDFEDLLCVMTGKNGKQITLSSILRQRGFCAYWTSEILSVDDILNYVPQNSLVEIMEPYGDEPMFHFVSSYDYPRGNIHAVISAKDLTKE